ncbi:hypothetical protein M422DRAFT_191965 [Sphaerobolus stellatus SS14]|uniref:Uncharacterized protein n=1 Tax=Sphaerobolus stellatus (strain SS14) TaxID=990650 RepID=A0A0C9UC05_SPHS4|nr:hypothetical protein M422DRAFT_191965 [Sphaerobolus stellatus SS14]
MFTFKISFYALLAISLLSIPVNAGHIKRLDVVPPVTYPTAGIDWPVGSSQTVTWDTSEVPPGFTGTGMILLGYRDNNKDYDEQLDISTLFFARSIPHTSLSPHSSTSSTTALNDPLARGFPLTAGSVAIVVPNVPSRNTYIVVLIGGSGNISGEFHIGPMSISNGTDIGTTSPTPTDTAPSTDASTPTDEAPSTDAAFPPTKDHYPLQTSPLPPMHPVAPSWLPSL